MTTTTRTDFDSELRGYDGVLHRACGIGLRDQVLDLGCGTGGTTRRAARSARCGSALGVDLDAAAVERAGDLARTARLRNVAFEPGDVQTHRFAPGRFDVAISRFGTMFFADPVAAFANVGRALRPGGRLVTTVWQAQERNEWIVELNRWLDAVAPRAAGVTGGPDPFSLADPSTVTEILGSAGFTDVAFADVSRPVHYGVDVAAALDWIRGFTATSAALDRLDPVAAEDALERLRATLAARADDDGIRFGSRAWIVTARSGLPA